MTGFAAIDALTGLPTRLDWGPGLFTFDARGTKTPANPMLLDITGPPRALVFGPYIALGPGTWRAQIRFTVDEVACRRRFKVEWGGLSDFGTLAFVPGRPGIYQAEIGHAWAEETVAEARIILMESALEGVLELIGVQIEAVR